MKLDSFSNKIEKQYCTNKVIFSVIFVEQKVGNPHNQSNKVFQKPKGYFYHNVARRLYEDNNYSRLLPKLGLN